MLLVMLWSLVAYADDAIICSNAKAIALQRVLACSNLLISGVLPDETRKQVLNSRGLARAKRGDDEEGAIADYNEAIKLDPYFADAFNNRGSAYFAKLDDKRAFIDFNKGKRSYAE